MGAGTEGVKGRKDFGVEYSKPTFILNSCREMNEQRRSAPPQLRVRPRRTSLSWRVLPYIFDQLNTERLD